MNASTYTDADLIRLALRTAASTRVTDLCNELGVTTFTARELQDRWLGLWNDALHDGSRCSDSTPAREAAS